MFILLIWRHSHCSTLGLSLVKSFYILASCYAYWSSIVPQAALQRFFCFDRGVLAHNSFILACSQLFHCNLAPKERIFFGKSWHRTQDVLIYKPPLKPLDQGSKVKFNDGYWWKMKFGLRQLPSNPIKAVHFLTQWSFFRRSLPTIKNNDVIWQRGASARSRGRHGRVPAAFERCTVMMLCHWWNRTWFSL